MKRRPKSLKIKGCKVAQSLGRKDIEWQVNQTKWGSQIAFQI